MSAVSNGNNWEGVIEIFNAVYKDDRLYDELSARIASDFFYASMRVGSRAASRHAHNIFLDIVHNDTDAYLLRPKGYNSLFVGLSKSCMIEEAKQVLENCNENEFYLNRYSYNAFLNACGKTNRLADAFLALRSMAESKIPPDVVSCNVLIACCVRGGEVDMALSILDRMSLWGLQPDIYSYNSVVNGFRKASLLEDAFDLVASMEIAANLPHIIEDRLSPKYLDIFDQFGGSEERIVRSNQSEEGRPKIESNSEAEGDDTDTSEVKLSSISKEALQSESSRTNTSTNSPSEENHHSSSNNSDVHSNSNNVDNKGGGKSQFKAIKPDLVTYNTLISGIAACKKPKLSRALQVHKHMQSLGIAGNEVTYNALMATATRSGKVDEAFLIYDDMLDKFVGMLNIELFTTLISLCGQAGMLERAFKVHEKMISIGIKPSVITFNALLTACRRSNRENCSDIALKVLGVMKETENCEPDVITYSTVIDTLGRDGRFEDLNSMLSDMKNKGLNPNFVTYTSMIGALCKHGLLEEAIERFHEMESLDIAPNEYTFSCLVGGARRKKDMKAATNFLDMMRERGILPNNVTYSLLMQMSIKSGVKSWLEKAIAYVREDERFDASVVKVIEDHAFAQSSKENLEIIHDAIDRVFKEM